MIRYIGDSMLKLIGDPHLGKEFVTGVPLHRKGERERSQFAHFRNELLDLTFDGRKAATCIIMGDIFDKFIVNHNVLMETFLILADAAYLNPDVTYIILQGNHDVSRDMEKISSFQVLMSMLSHLGNIEFIQDVQIIYTADGSDGLMLVPYDAFKSARQLVEEQQVWKTNDLIAAFGHWDIECFDGKDFNLIPLEQLAPLVDYIYTGHIHAEQDFVVDKQGQRLVHTNLEQTSFPIVLVTVTGSMQPCSHAEDPLGRIYVTVTLEQYQDAIAKDSKIFHNKFLRFDLKKGEELPPDIDAQSITFRYFTEVQSDEVEVKMAVFNFQTLFEETFKENEVPDDTTKKVWSEYEELVGDVERT